jgi:hypothetical protein
MKKMTHLFAIALASHVMVGVVHAQALTGGVLLPANPTSADNLKLSIADRTCGGALPYAANPYRITMSQNIITVNLNERVNGIFTICAPAPREEIDIGRLPAGSYAITLIEAAIGSVPQRTLIDKTPITIADARATKAAPYVRLDYSGAWWDPNDSGWGLFIWQDARGPNDSLLAAWFSYTPDGKPMWYTFQPKWQTSSATAEAALLQASRPPGATSPPPGTTSSVTVGTASLDFTNLGTADEGKLTYTFNNGTKLVRTIQRLKP